MGVAKVIDVSGLKNKMQQFEAQVEGWASARLEAAGKEHAMHKNTVYRAQDKLRQLKQTEEQMLHKATQLEQRLEHERGEEHRLAEALAQVQAQEEELLPKIQQLQASINGMQAKSEAEKQVLSDKLQSKQDQLMNLHTAQVAFYRHRLGLRFDRTPQQVLRMVFTKIDAADPTREFIVGVKVLDDNKTYTVPECEPPVDELGALVQALNVAGDLRGFVLTMRKAFLKTVTSQ